MASSRILCRCPYVRQSFRSVPKVRIVRPYSSANSQAGTNSQFSQAVTGGLVGGSVVFLGGYAYYYFSGAKTLVDKTRQTKQYIDSASQKLKESAPEPNEALEWLRNTATTYVAFIPGAKGYVDTAFNDLDTIRSKHGDKVDKIVRDAYTELKDVSQSKGMTVEGAEQAWAILQKHLKSISDLAGDATSDILKNHPEIEKVVGKDLDQLKQFGDKYGPEAKKQIERTKEQINDIIKSGVSMETASKIRSVIEEKRKIIEELAAKGWKQGMEQAKPYLDKSPEVKELIEKNADSLKQGNVKELWDKVKESATSGDSSSIESYIKSAVENAKQQGGGISGGLEEYLKKIPGASEIIPKFSQLQEIADKHGKEAESLLKETFEEIQQVLQRRMDEAKKLADKAEKRSR